ncbi:uncharacterized protein LACBIDRAFT_296572 [Laccaria bicolor S238N-H82]|uniref:Predicted protein n=1 Tax=Laccaria bicolor (strain S238N-H82 / ATCC MYA-4686) TaxID=486041 RepID=B0D952_LACBS|nr:uncharacterized protein LACBIDRAFT_296572 [Laccaria bicolor S238N-H82]EDR08951.1 predicted protein [Laccaria bicolor S238N-H82]|eukprot:XP_001880264.1 predicted protein [Laccaria bicolor S238N-H82]
MLRLLVSSILSLLVLVNAQGIIDLPVCSLSCVTQTAASVGCLLTDTTCLCSKPNFVSTTVTCAQGSCTLPDLSSTNGVLNEICATAPAPATSSSSSSSAVPSISISSSTSSTSVPEIFTATTSTSTTVVAPAVITSPPTTTSVITSSSTTSDSTTVVVATIYQPPTSHAGGLRVGGQLTLGMVGLVLGMAVWC